MNDSNITSIVDTLETELDKMENDQHICFAKINQSLSLLCLQTSFFGAFASCQTLQEFRSAMLRGFRDKDSATVFILLQNLMTVICDVWDDDESAPIFDENVCFDTVANRPACCEG